MPSATTVRPELPRGLYWRDLSPFIWLSFTRVNGEPVRTSTRTKDPKEAQAILESLRTKDREGKNEFFDKKRNDEKSNFLFSQAAEEAGHVIKNRCPDSWGSFYQPILEALARRWGSVPLAEIGTPEITAFVSSRLATPRCKVAKNSRMISRNRVNKELVALRQVFKVAVDNKRIQPSQMPEIRSLKVDKPNANKNRFWSLEDIKRIFAALDRMAEDPKESRYAGGRQKFPTPLFQDMVRFSLASWMRKSEALYCTVGQIKKTVALLQNTKSGHDREVVLTETEIEIIRRHSQGKSPSDPLFTWNEKPIKPYSFRKKFIRLLKLAGLEKGTWHWLRHAGITLGFSANMPPTYVQKRAGHTSLKTTELYNHPFEEYEKDHVENFGGFLGNLLPGQFSTKAA